MAGTTILDFYRNELERPRADHYRHVTLTGIRRLSTADFFSATTALAEGLAALGVRRGDRVLLLSDNRPEWHQVDLATLALGAADVPVYPTLGADAVAYHAADSGAVVAVTENPMQSAKVLARRDAAPRLRYVIQIEGELPEGVLELEDVVSAYRTPDGADRFWRRAAEVGADDLASVVYTSGTTGAPKGVMLTHGNFVANVEAVLPRVDLKGDDRALEFLPLCHVFERTCGYAYMARGVTRTYCPPALVADNIATVAPTVFASVPRLYEKIHSTISSRVAASSALRRRLFAWAVGVGRRASALRLEGKPPALGLRLAHALADALVLGKIRAAFGGRVHFALSGGAPLARELNEFFHAVGIAIQEGYGLTETSPAISISGCAPGENRLGAVGRPLPNLEIRFTPDGELLVRGPSVTAGYWQRPEATAEAFDEEGFLRTGDVARLDEDGFLIITDRKKDLIIPAGGKNVAPQPIENELRGARFVDNAVLIGDRKPYIVALLSPDEEAINAWAASQGFGGLTLGELLVEPVVKSSIAAAVAEVNSHLGHFEQVKAYRVLPRALTLEEGYLTPTLKVKRRLVERDFAPLIEEMYAGA